MISKEIKNPKNLCEMLSRENYNSSLQDFEAEIKKKEQNTLVNVS